jgi:hypothetical protein
MNRPRLLHVVPLAALALGVGLTAAPASAAASGTFTATGSMHAAHTEGKATLLQNGQVLLTGGNSGGGAPALPSPELYNPATGTWAVTGQMNTPREDSTATLLPDGQVLAAGGTSQSGTFALVRDWSQLRARQHLAERSGAGSWEAVFHAAGARVTLWPRASSLAMSRWVSFAGSARLV